MQRSLRTQLTALFLLVALIPLLVIAVVGLIQSLTTQVTQGLAQQNEIARRVSILVSGYVQDAEEGLRVLVEVRDIQDLPTSEAELVLLNMLNYSDIYDQISLVNSAGRELNKVSRSTIIGSDPLISFKGMPEFELPISTGKTYYSDIIFNADTGEPYLILSLPITDLTTGQVEGVLIAKLRFRTIWSLMTISSVGEQLVFLTDAKNRVVAHPNSSVVLQGRNFERPSDAQLMVGLQGETAALGVAPVVISDQEVFYVVTELPWQVAFAASIQFVITSIIALLITIVVTVVFSIWQTRQFIRPIEELAQGAREIAAGDWSKRVFIKAENEIGLLGATFNEMAVQLQGIFSNLEQRVEERTRALATTSEVSRRISTILDEATLAKEVVEDLKTAFNYYHAHIYLLDESGETLTMAGGTGEAGVTLLNQGHRIPVGRGLVGRAADTRKTVLVPNTADEEGWLPNPLLPETQSEIAVPILAGDKVLGVLDVQNNVADSLGAQDADLIGSIASQVAIALQNIRQFQITQKIATDLSVVANVGIATATITDRETLLQEVVDLAKKSFNLYHAHIYLINETGDSLVLAAGAGEVGRKMVAEGRSIALDSEKSLVARAARIQEGVVVNDVRSDPDFLPNPLLPETRAEMAVPMIVGGKVLGVLDVQADFVGRFTQTDVSIKTTLAAQVGIALQNARNFEQTRQQAEREARLNLIGQRIAATTSVADALQIAARELGHALGQRQTVVAIERPGTPAQAQTAPDDAANDESATGVQI